MTSDLSDTHRPGTTPTTAGDWLQGAPAALVLPTDRPRPTSLSAERGRTQVPLSADAVAAARVLAARTGTDVDVVLLALFAVVLARTTDESDLVIGIADEQADAQGAVAVLRVRIDLEADLDSAVSATARALTGAAARGARTVAEWVVELGLEPGPGRHPLFQVAARTGVRTDASSWPGSWSVLPDLVLGWCWERDEAVLLVEWAAQLFDPVRIERSAGHLVQLLVAGASSRGTAVGVVPMLSRDELDELDRWNSTAAPHDPSVTLADRFWAQVDATPGAVAVEHHGETLTYQDLARRAASVAGVLRARGVEPDGTVVVCASRSIDMVVGVLGTLMTGAGYVPVDPAYPAGRRDFMITHSGARVLLTQRALAHVVSSAGRADVLLLDELPDVEPPPRDQLRGRSGQDLGYVVYTSGSTGEPKAVAMPQSALGNLVEWQLSQPGFEPGARVLQFSALSFDVSFQEMFTTWASGGTLVLVDEATRRDPVGLLDHLVEHRVERLFLPFVALRGLASAARSSGRTPTSLREVYTAGEQLQVDPLLRALFEALPAAVLHNQYGPSESHVVTAHTLDRDVTGWPPLPPVGRPIANSHAHVLDARLQRRPVGVPGELHLGGTCLARGYLGRDDLTSERFVAAPEGLQGERLYRTGDLVRWLPSGELEFLGRIDHQVKFRGYRIEPGEVAAVLSGAPGVGHCVALVREGAGGPRLTAYLVPDPAGDTDVGAVHRFARARLPAYMVPSHYSVVPGLPLTSSGKVDTAALPDAAFDRGILSHPYQAPRTPEELVLTSVWSHLLGVPEVGVLDDFFELGGDSLLAAEMLVRVAEQLGRELPLGALAQATTAQALAALLRTHDDRALARSLVPLQRGSGTTTPLFVVHGGSGNVATFPRLARALPPEQPVYALQWDGSSRGRGQRSVRGMARHYLRELRAVQPDGPYLLAGQCIGGLVAHEMARRLVDMGEQVSLLVMYDSPHLGSPAYVPGPSTADRLRTRAGRRAMAYTTARAVWRRRPWRDDPIGRGSEAMVVAARRHRAGDLPPGVPTHFVGSGEWRGTELGLDGHWTDGALGWASVPSPTLTVHRLQGGHNEVLYSQEAVAVLREALRQAHARHDASA